MRGARGRAGLCLAAWLSATAEAAQAETVTYSYDALGRLVATTSSSGPSSTLSYDAAGNRSSYNVSTGGPTIADWSFEQPPIGSGYVYNPTVTGATFAGNTGVAGNASAWSFPTAPDGTQAAFLQGAGSATSAITLTISGLTVGTSYKIGFLLVPRPNYVELPVEVRVGGALLGSYSLTSTAWQAFQTPSFQATATTMTVEFRAGATSGYLCVGFDKVTINAVP